MKESTKQTTHHHYTFIFWLIVPLLLAWLGANYFLGAITKKPEWADKNSQPSPSPTIVAPYSQDYPPLFRKGSGLVTLWFDDGWDSQYLTGYPIMDRYGYKGAIAVVTGVVGSPNYVNWPQLVTLQENGWEITNHTVQHSCEMDTWPKAKIDAELTTASNELWSHKLSSDLFVSPCGVDSDTLREVVKEKFSSFRGVEPGLNDLKNIDPYDLRVRNVTNETTVDQLKAWVDEAVNSDGWVILVFHQVGNLTQEDNGELYAINTPDFQALIDYIHQIDVQVVLPSQVLSTYKEVQP